jgi:hypothetical protein
MQGVGLKWVSPFWTHERMSKFGWLILHLHGSGAEQYVYDYCKTMYRYQTHL